MTGKKSGARILALLLGLLMPSLLASQAAAPAPVTAEPQPVTAAAETVNRVLLAISSNVYPVIPGDTYRLTYRSGGTSVVNDLVVDSNYSLSLNIFGKIDAHGKTYLEVKAEAEKLITKAYPNSLPSFILVSVGIFEVIVRGAVPQTAFVNAWGLTRLGDVVNNNLAAYSSIRDIVVRSRDGKKTTYDLLTAFRGGNQSQNPYIKPGDIVEISRADRIIEIKGEVYRPGVYQLLPGEGIESLDFFAGGFTKDADTARIKIERNRENMSSVVYFNFQSAGAEELASGGLTFENGDILTVPSRTESMPVVFIEGALQTATTPQLSTTIPEIPVPTAAGTTTTTTTQPVTTGIQGYNRIVYQFRQGETVFDALSSSKASIAPFANLSQAYIIRQSSGDRIPVDLERLLYDTSAREQDIALRPFDRIVIPSSNYDITVTGDLTAPGRYPFVPQKKLDYYVSLAGGVDLLTGDTSSQVSLFNTDGVRKDGKADVEPGDRIFVHPSSNMITVNGAVVTPGSYSFVPQENASYYVSKAGGLDFDRTADGRVTVYAIDGKKRPDGADIMPGDRVYVHSNSFIYNFNRYFPIISTGLAFITTMVTLINLLNTGNTTAE